MADQSNNRVETAPQDIVDREPDCRSLRPTSRSRVPRSIMTLRESSNSLVSSSQGSSSRSQSFSGGQRPCQNDAHISAPNISTAPIDSDVNSDDDMSDISTESASATITTKQTDLRKKIIEIQRNPKIPQSEKAKLIQDLMTKPWDAKIKQDKKNDTRINNFLADKPADFSVVTEKDKEQSFHSDGVLGCKHYQRACKLQAHCCGKWDTCRFCHDEVSDHSITRNLVKTMMCMYCSFVQPTGAVCINQECGKKVAAYYCKECKLWDNDPRKNIYHCYDCGICRIGKGLGIDYFHCPTCNVCMAIGLKGKHKCIERNLESDCPICGEYMFTSTSTVIFMPCGHCMHHKCHQQHIHTSYQCPTCLKSLADMSEYFKRIDAALAQHRMPPEYNNTYSQIYCNDCEKRSFAKFHFIYHKCGHCTGYNTKMLNTQTGLPLDAVIAKPVLVVANPINPLSRLNSSSSISSASNSVDSTYTGIWCHHCQGPTELVQEAGNDRCHTCLSDFVERLEN